jgi:hypothetical protein
LNRPEFAEGCLVLESDGQPASIWGRLLVSYRLHTFALETMSKKKKLTRFTVTCNGRVRQVFKIRDHGNELRLMLTPAEHYTDPPFRGREILEQRYSIHATENSPRKINVIKQTI